MADTFRVREPRTLLWNLDLHPLEKLGPGAPLYLHPCRRPSVTPLPGYVKGGILVRTDAWHLLPEGSEELIPLNLRWSAEAVAYGGQRLSLRDGSFRLIVEEKGGSILSSNSWEPVEETSLVEGIANILDKIEASTLHCRLVLEIEWGGSPKRILLWKELMMKFSRGMDLEGNPLSAEILKVLSEGPPRTNQDLVRLLPKGATHHSVRRTLLSLQKEGKVQSSLDRISGGNSYTLTPAARTLPLPDLPPGVDKAEEVVVAGIVQIRVQMGSQSVHLPLPPRSDRTPDVLRGLLLRAKQLLTPKNHPKEERKPPTDIPLELLKNGARAALAQHRKSKC